MNPFNALNAVKPFTGSAPDQYYAVTSGLTAGGYRRTTMRMVGGYILTLGLPPLLAAANPAASSIPGGRAVLAISPLACTALAAVWLRDRWPTRGQSITVVVLGTLLLAAGCIAAINPFSGLLVGTSFAFVIGYVSLFHGPPVQLFVIVAAAVTTGWLAVQIAMIDSVAAAVAVTTPVVLIDAAVLFAGRTIADMTASVEARTDVHPLTGLLPRQAFDEVAGNLIGARNRGDDRYLVIVMLTVDSYAALLSVKGRRGADEALIAVGLALRDTVRRDAVIGHVGEAEFLVADVFTAADPAPLAERIRGAIAATPVGITASIGVVCTPLPPLANRPPEDVLDEFIALATTAMHRARRHGGNTADYVIEPA
jgi:diguanylate cyclase (GGDEF)-like protein